MYGNGFHHRNGGFLKNGFAVSRVRTAGTRSPDYSDDFDDFDQAIQEAINRGYNVAWSNQSFEYWLYLHFYYSDSALHRHQWNAKLDEIFKKNNLGDGTYQKNYDDIYSLVDIYGGVTVAIKHAKRRMAEFERGGYKPSEYDPGTMVYKLVESLKVYLE